MVDQSPEVGIQEVLDVLDFLTNSISDLADSSSGGKISVVGWAKMAIKEAPEAIKALKGIGEVPIELKNLNADEMKQIADAGMQLTSAVMRLMGMDKK